MKYSAKEFLRRNLPSWLFNLIMRIFNSIQYLWYGICVLGATLLIKGIGLFSKRLLVEIKERLSVIVKLDYLQEDIFIHTDSIIEFTTRRNSCSKEPETIHWIETYIKEYDVVYDIGANIGAYSFVIDKYTKGKALIYAFEPSFSTFAQLSKNIYLNHCQGNIIPLYIALSNKTEIGKLNYSSLTPGTALHALGVPTDQHGNTFQPVYEQPILSFAIDDFVERFNIQPPNHIKLDVDGIEFEILQGANNTLSNSKLVSILVEVEPAQKSSAKIVEYLQAFGFSIVLKKQHGENESATSNYLFIRK